MKPIIYFLYEAWFYHFFHGLFQAKISVYDSLHFETKKIATSLFFFWWNLIFLWSTLFPASVSKNFTGAFLWDIGGNNGFSQANSGGQIQVSTEVLR